MATFHRIQDMRVWHLARKLTAAVYQLSGEKTFHRDSALRNQLRRASVSIVSNIAEGFERNGSREFLQFLSVAKGSAGEVLSQLHVANDQNYCNSETFRNVQRMALQTIRMLEKLMAYLRSSDLRGRKFKI